MLTLNDGRSELWQWDTNLKLTVDADCSQVHFSNKVFGRSIDVDVVGGVAIIPDILLQTDKDLNVWAFVGTAENGYTKISKVFKVNKRNKPADYVFTPPEQTSLEEILEKIDYLESIQGPDAIKDAVNDYLEQNPVEAPVQSVNGKTGEVELTAEDVGAISRGELQETTNEALAQAKASGEFDGADGKDGEDYVLTNEDKQEIAELTAPLVEVPQGGGGTKRWTVLHEAELTEEATLLITDFDATLSEYVMQLIVPKVSATLKAGNAHFLGARAFTYSQPFGSTGYASHYTYHATILSGERMLMVKYENQANGTGFDNEYSTTFQPAKGSALSCNVAKGIDISCTFPVGTKVRLEGR